MNKQKVIISVIVAVVATLGIIMALRFLPISELFQQQNVPVKLMDQKETMPAMAQQPNIKPDSNGKVSIDQSSQQDEGEVIVVDQTDQVKAIAQSDKPMVIKFYSNWCPACMAAKAVYPEIAQQMPKVTFYSVNIENGDVMKAFEAEGVIKGDTVQAIPTFVFYQKGKINKSTKGFGGKDHFKMEVTKNFGA